MKEMQQRVYEAITKRMELFRIGTIQKKRHVYFHLEDIVVQEKLLIF